MKAISSPLVITSVRSKVDNSLGFSATTPELSHEEKVCFMELQGINLTALFKPVDVEPTAVQKIQTPLDGVKTPSQRLRSVLYLLYTMGNDNLVTETFDHYYDRKISQIIITVKNKIDQGRQSNQANGSQS